MELEPYSNASFFSITFSLADGPLRSETEWYDYPEHVRAAFIAAMPELLISSGVQRIKIQLEYEKSDEAKEMVARNYIPFVESWDLLPKHIRDSILQELSPFSHGRAS